MRDHLKHWLSANAKWWQFWMPQSGGRGGVVFGLLLGVLIALIVFTTSR